MSSELDVEAGASDGVARWRAAWDRQQEAHEPDRESRFAIMLDFVELLAGPPTRVLDLACGTGAITERVRRRFPSAEVVGIDLDPLLLALARGAFTTDTAVRLVDADLRDPSWSDGMGEPFDAVLTATALHWLEEPRLARVYADVAGVLRKGGVFANADHVLITDPEVAGAATRAHQRHRETSFAEGRESYDQWWARIATDPHYSVLVTERARRFEGWNDEVLLPASWHMDRLRAVGFSRADVVWRWGNDAVVVGVH